MFIASLVGLQGTSMWKAIGILCIYCYQKDIVTILIPHFVSVSLPSTISKSNRFGGFQDCSLDDAKEGASGAGKAPKDFNVSL
jgi:hypothetical protein